MRPVAALLSVAVVVTAAAAPVPKALRPQRSDAERFVGRWEVSTELNGQPLTTHAREWAIDAGLAMKSFHPGGAVLDWVLTLDPAKSPKEISISTYKGIYEWDGDTVRIAYTTAGDRPTGFDPQPGVYVETLRRAGESGR